MGTRETKKLRSFFIADILSDNQENVDNRNFSSIPTNFPEVIENPPLMPFHFSQNNNSTLLQKCRFTDSSFLAQNVVRYQDSLKFYQNISLSDRNPQIFIPQSFDTDRKARQTYSEYQLKSLEAEFQVNKYLSTTRRLELSMALSLTEIQIKIWFQNRRTKWKKHISRLNKIARRNSLMLSASSSVHPGICENVFLNFHSLSN